MANNIFQFLHGLKSRFEGISGTFVYDTWTARYPYQHEVEKLRFEFSREGKKTEEYQAIKRMLGDDYVVDLTDNIDFYVNEAIKLGYKGI